MRSSKIENRFYPDGSKFIWVVCNNIDGNLEEDSSKCAMDVAETPNLDRLCSQSETGMLRRSLFRESPSVDRESVSGLSILEIDTTAAPLSMLEGVFRLNDRQEVGGLPGVEDALTSVWNHYDLFLLRLSRMSAAERLGEELSRIEWIEMLDVWLPGLFAHCRPDVFAISSDVWVGDGRDEKLPAPALLHSARSKALSTEGFCLHCCRQGRLGTGLTLGDWLHLLLAHATVR